MILGLAMATASLAGYYAYWLSGNYYFHGQGIGCFATGTEGSSFPRTLVEWNVGPGAIIDVGIRVKLGENPYFPYVYRPVGFSVFLKNAGAYPQPEVPEDFFALSGLNLSDVSWEVRVSPNASVYGQWPPYLDEVMAPFAIDPQHWYSLRILIQGDRHTFYVDGRVISIVIAHSEYSRRTAFGVSPALYACFGNFYVKSYPTYTISILDQRRSLYCPEQ